MPWCNGLVKIRLLMNVLLNMVSSFVLIVLCVLQKYCISFVVHCKGTTKIDTAKFFFKFFSINRRFGVI